MSAYKANPLLDAATVLVGWTNCSATRDTEQLFASGEVVRLNTKLDATLHFTLMVSHPGSEVAVETQLELAPLAPRRHHGHLRGGGDGRHSGGRWPGRGLHLRQGHPAGCGRPGQRRWRLPLLCPRHRLPFHTRGDGGRSDRHPAGLSGAMTDRFPSTTVAAATQQGMVRIHRVAELRCVWPVHLAGWLSSGWQLGDDSRGRAADAQVATPITAGATATASVSSSSPAPTASSQPASAPERNAEPLDAHLPTNLLDLDLEPAPPKAPSQNDSERNDAGFASFAGGDHTAGAPAGMADLVADAASLDAPAESAIEDVTTAQSAEPTAAATDPSPEAPQAPALQQAQAPARRGRPRKNRPEAQPETHPEPGKEPRLMPLNRSSPPPVRTPGISRTQPRCSSPSVTTPLGSIPSCPASTPLGRRPTSLSPDKPPAACALLGALAIVFQGLLRDFAAGLVVLFDDRYAIGDSVDLGGLSGEVVDLGVLSTELRGADSRVMTVPNSGCEPVENHTKLCSGAELRLPLAPGGLDLADVLEVVRQDVASFAADSDRQPSLLQPPQLRGVSEVTVDAVWLSVLLTTLAGRHNAARRELLARLVERLGREGLALAGSAR